MKDETLDNAAYQLFRLMGGWVSRQCYEEPPTVNLKRLCEQAVSEAKVGDTLIVYPEE